MPTIIIYIAVGFSFLKTYHFVALKQNSTDVEHTLTASLVIGYVYCTIAYLIPFSINKYIDNLGIILSSIIVAYGIGRFTLSTASVKLFDFLKIRDTCNLYLWDDLMDVDYPMEAVITFEEVSYRGYVHLYENYSNTPKVILASYYVYNNEDSIIEDFSQDATRTIVLDVATAKHVQIIYNKNSNCSKDIKQLCDLRVNEEEQEN